MKTSIFPISYFTSIITPKGMLLGRHAMKWWQIVLVFIFLTAIMIIPVPFYYNNLTSVDMANYSPAATKLLENNELQSTIKTRDYTANQFTQTDKLVVKQTKANLIGFNITAKAAKKSSNAVVFNKDEMILQESVSNNTPVQTVIKYDKKFNPKAKDFMSMMNKVWYQANKSVLTTYMMLVIGMMYFISNLIIVIIAALLLYLGRKAPTSDVKTYKEAVNLVLNAITLGTLITLVVGLVHFDVVLTVMIQAVCLIIALLAIMARTGFNDKKAQNKDTAHMRN